MKNYLNLLFLEQKLSDYDSEEEFIEKSKYLYFDYLESILADKCVFDPETNQLEFIWYKDQKRKDIKEKLDALKNEEDLSIEKMRGILFEIKENIKIAWKGTKLNR